MNYSTVIVKVYPVYMGWLMDQIWSVSILTGHGRSLNCQIMF